MIRGIEVRPDFVNEVHAIGLEDVVRADRQVQFLEGDATRHSPSVGRGSSDALAHATTARTGVKRADSNTKLVEAAGVEPASEAASPGISTSVSRILVLRSEEHTSELQSQSNLVCRL